VLPKGVVLLMMVSACNGLAQVDISGGESAFKFSVGSDSGLDCSGCRQSLFMDGLGRRAISPLVGD